MSTEKDSEITVIERKNYEIIEWEGQEARFFPRTGAIMVFSERYNRWIIRANKGGRVDIDGKAMVLARELKKEQAIVDGLQNAAYELDLRSASDVLSTIVAARAKNAIDDEGRTGNADAKFIFSLINQDGKGDEEGPSLRVDMDADAAREFISSMKEVLKERKDESE